MPTGDFSTWCAMCGTWTDHGSGACPELKAFRLRGDAPAPKHIRVRNWKVNPCIRVYGPGPAGAQCRTCVHLIRPRHGARVYPKCELRGNTHGPGTDHRVKWAACGQYERSEAVVENTTHKHQEEEHGGEGIRAGDCCALGRGGRAESVHA